MAEEGQLISSPLIQQNGNYTARLEDSSLDLAATTPTTRSRSFWAESKAIWSIAGAAIVSRIATSGLTVITQAFVGHIGDLELAAFSLVVGLLVGFDSGILIGMGNALGTLCGQAFGANKHHMLGIYLQRSWIVLTGFAVLLLPLYLFITPILRLLGQTEDVAQLSGTVALWCIPLHFSFPFYFAIQRYLISQRKNVIVAWSAVVGTIVSILLNCLFVLKLNMGLNGALVSLDIGWWIPAIIQFLYVICGGCPLTWTGFSREAFDELWPFIKLSASSGVMLCVEIWYYKILVLMTGQIKNTEVIVSALTICLNLDDWELSIPLGFLVATSVRVANQLGAHNPDGAKFSVLVSTAYSSAVGIMIWVLLLVFRTQLGYLFTNSTVVQEAVAKLAILLAFTIILNSVQPVLVGVAIGLGKQSFVAYVNIICYYLIGLPFGLVLGFVFHLSIRGIWIGMICGSAIQTTVLIFITWKTNWDKEVIQIRNQVTTMSSSASVPEE